MSPEIDKENCPRNQSQSVTATKDLNPYIKNLQNNAIKSNSEKKQKEGSRMKKGGDSSGF